MTHSISRYTRGIRLTVVQKKTRETSVVIIDISFTAGPGVGYCFLLKLEYYSSENLLMSISDNMLISPA